MALPSLTLRNVKGTALTFTEMDTNLQNLANATIGVTAGGTTSSINLNSGITVANSASVQATLAGNVLTLSSSGVESIISITAGGATHSDSGFTFANTDTVVATLSGNVISLASSNQFGANVDANGYTLNNVVLNTYREKVANVGPLTGTVTVDANVAPVQTAAVTGNITINTNNVSNMIAGESVTLILYQTGAYTLTSNLKFVQGTKTISTTAGNVDALTIFYDGTSYIAGLAKYW